MAEAEVEAEMLKLFGGALGLAKAPIRMMQRQRLRIIAIMEEQVEREQAEKARQEEEARRAPPRGGR